MKITRVLTRETDCSERGVPIVVEIHPREVVLRLKGERTRYPLSWDGLYWSAVRAAAERERKDKLVEKALRTRRRP